MQFFLFISILVLLLVFQRIKEQKHKQLTHTRLTVYTHPFSPANIFSYCLNSFI
jgi:hypothetical protein